jgi:hypothetical protein
MTTGTVANVSTIGIVDLIDEITVIIDPIFATMTGIDVIITTTTAAMIGATTTVAMTVATGVTTIGVIVVMIATMTSATIDEMIDVMIDVARMTTICTTIIGRNELHHHRPNEATPIVHFRRPIARSSSSSAVAKRPKATNRTNQTPGRSGKLILKTHGLYVGLNSQSLSLGMIIGLRTRRVPVVDG